MKIRHAKKKQKYLFWEKGKAAKKFDKKDTLMRYLNRIGERALNGTVSFDTELMGSSFTSRQWFVWYNRNKALNGIFEIELKQLDFRGKKFICKPHKQERSRVRYFIYSEQIISLMGYIADGNYTDSNLTNLLILFHKRGFRDFKIEDEYDTEYYNRDSHKTLETFKEWSYWSDRCDFLRAKIIHDLIKRERPEAFKKYLEKI